MKAELRLAVPAVVAWLVVAVLLVAPVALEPAMILAWILAAACLGLAVVVRGRQRVVGAMALAAITLAAIGLVLAAAATQSAARTPGPLRDAASHGRVVHAEAVVVEAVQSQTQRYRATLRSVTVGAKHFAVAVPVLVFNGSGGRDVKRAAAAGASSNAASADIGIGSVVALKGTVRAAQAGDDVSFLFFASGSPELRAAPPWFISWANQLRHGFADAARVLPGEGGDLLPGLSIGDTSAVSVELDQAMKTSSLSHLTAVSGANCAVVIALVMAAGAAIGVGRGLRIAASMLILVGFVVLVTPQPSVLRAAVMAALVLATMASGRPIRGIPVLALAVLVLLVVDPWLARSYGFVLSVLATAGLLVLARPLAAVLARWLPTALAAVIAIPLVAQLACQPVLVLLNPAIPLYSVPANVLAEPAAPIATVLGLISCVVTVWFPGLGLLIAQLAWVPSSWIAAVARFFSRLPAASIPWPAGTIGVTLVAVITALALVLLLVGGAHRWRWRTLTAGALALVLVCCLGVSVGHRVHDAITRPQDWQIAACDIGQGDAVFVRSSGQLALIDTGPDPALLTRCLRLLGIDHIDLLVLTHYDLDHVGGTPAVVGMVDRAMIGPPANAHETRFSQQLRAGGARVAQVSRGEKGELGELHWDVLWPPTRLGLVEPGNDSSVTVEFSAGGKCAKGCLHSLFLGDLGNEPQMRMLAANRGLGHVDVVKVAHHGSSDQDPELYARISATVGVISVGAHNRYGHPTDRLLGILADVGTRVERTDRQGMVLISPRPGGGMSMWSERSSSSVGRAE